MISNTSYSTGDSNINRVHLYVYMALEVFLGFFIILSLSLDKWFNYCVFSFGIHRIYTIDSDAGSTDRFISELQDTCDDYDNAFEAVCEDLCDNIDRLRSASDAIISMSAFTLFLIFVTLVLYYTRLVKPDFRISIRNSIISGFLFNFLQLILYVFGLILYGGIGQMHNYDDPDCDYAGGADCDDFTVRGGLAIAIVTAILMLPISIYGFFATRKALTD
jgi:hypothetical protein